MLFRQESTHGIGIHSDGEEEDFSDEEPHVEHPRRPSHHSVHQQLQHLVPDNDHHEGLESDISKSTSAISLDSSRDKKTVAEKLQAAFGYPEVEEFVGGKIVLTRVHKIQPSRSCAG